MMDVQERLRRYILYKGLTVSEFQRICGLGSGYVSKITDSMGKRGLADIARNFSDLNTDWLLHGTGEMLKKVVPSQTSRCNNSPNIAGNGNQFNPNAYDTLLRIVETYQASTSKFQEQIDRLITIIERQL